MRAKYKYPNARLDYANNNRCLTTLGNLFISCIHIVIFFLLYKVGTWCQVIFFCIDCRYCMYCTSNMLAIFNSVMPIESITMPNSINIQYLTNSMILFIIHPMSYCFLPYKIGERYSAHAKCQRHYQYLTNECSSFHVHVCLNIQSIAISGGFSLFMVSK